MIQRIATLMMWECNPHFASPCQHAGSGNDNRGSGQPTDNCNQEKHQENEEKYFGYPGGCTCNATKTEDGSDDGNDEENYGPLKHCYSPHMN